MGLLAAFVAMLVLGVGTAYAVMEPVSLIGVSGDALASSLDDHFDDADYSLDPKPRCSPVAGDLWRCEIADGSDSSSPILDRLVAQVDDEGCWVAREWRPAGKRPPPEPLARGCIGFLDATGLSVN